LAQERTAAQPEREAAEPKQRAGSHRRKPGCREINSQPKTKDAPNAEAAYRQTVRVQVVIGTDGKVKNATVLSGPQPLQVPPHINSQHYKEARYGPDGFPQRIKRSRQIGRGLEI
jgi:hypothetical protein